MFSVAVHFYGVLSVLQGEPITLHIFVCLLVGLAMGSLRNAVFRRGPLRLMLIQMLFWFFSLELSKLCLFFVSSFLEFLALGFWE